MTVWQFPFPNAGISSPFGWRKNPLGQGIVFHSGIDNPVSYRDVYAPTDGTVVYVDRTDDSTWGVFVWVRATDGAFFGMAHLSRIDVQVGTRVTRGVTCIGRTGNTGGSTGPHLHFTISVAPTFAQAYALDRKFLVDPVPYIRSRTSGTAGGDTTPIPESEEDAIMLCGYTYMDGTSANCLLVDWASGWAHEFSNGTAFNWGYINPISVAFRTQPWASITESLARVIKQQAAAIRDRYGMAPGAGLWSGFYYTRAADKHVVSLILNTTTGAYYQYDNGTSTASTLNGAIAKSHQTGSFALITESHANVMISALLAVQEAREKARTASGGVTVGGGLTEEQDALLRATATAAALAETEGRIIETIPTGVVTTNTYTYTPKE